MNLKNIQIKEGLENTSPELFKELQKIDQIIESKKGVMPLTASDIMDLMPMGLGAGLTKKAGTTLLEKAEAKGAEILSNKLPEKVAEAAAGKLTKETGAEVINTATNKIGKSYIQRIIKTVTSPKFVAWTVGGGTFGISAYILGMTPNTKGDVSTTLSMATLEARKYNDIEKLKEIGLKYEDLKNIGFMGEFSAEKMKLEEGYAFNKQVLADLEKNMAANQLETNANIVRDKLIMGETQQPVTFTDPNQEQINQALPALPEAPKTYTVQPGEPDRNAGIFGDPYAKPGMTTERKSTQAEWEATAKQRNATDIRKPDEQIRPRKNIQKKTTQKDTTPSKLKFGM